MSGGWERSRPVAVHFNFERSLFDAGALPGGSAVTRTGRPVAARIRLQHLNAQIGRRQPCVSATLGHAMKSNGH